MSFSGVEIAAEAVEEFENALKADVDGANLMAEWGGQRSRLQTHRCLVNVSGVRDQMRAGHVDRPVEAVAQFLGELAKAIESI